MRGGHSELLNDSELKGGSVVKPKHQLSLVGIVFAFLLTACLGNPDDTTVPCFEFDGERVCTETGGDFSIALPFDPVEAEGWIVRFHPEDVQRYGFSETLPVVPNERTGRTTVFVERTVVSPSTVCVNQDVYVQDLEAGQQILIFEAGDCTVRLLSLIHI